MLIAELRGKIPSKLARQEDILTSNVFSFFKYSNRFFLQKYLKSLELDISSEEAKRAEFIFWPKYGDGTEPDLIIRCGRYYILFEAKYFSDFSSGITTDKSQINREIKNGKREANNLDREFIYVAITAEYYEKKNKYDHFKRKTNFKWTNWQSITKLLSDYIYEINQDVDFANDLLSLLIKKNLRQYEGFYDLKPKTEVKQFYPFYDKKSSIYQKPFVGFYKSLEHIPVLNSIGQLFNKSYFSFLSEITLQLISSERVLFE